MKFRSLFAVAAMGFLIPALAFAGSKNSTNLQLDQPVTVAGTQLAPGQYKVTWDGSGPNVTVSFAEGRKTVATAQGKLLSNPTNEQAIETQTVAGNPTVLQAIDLKKITIQFENTATSTGN
jgi:hypothetical protein